MKKELKKNLNTVTALWFLMKEIVYTTGRARLFGSTYYIKLPRELVQAKLIDPSKPLKITLEQVE